ncbi:MAG: NAD(P)-dependent oxidoreductase [Anaerolineales bacterium]|nr:NAD(P)-dependent oxidoreductase [Anaerolineales bacterium]
MREELIKLQSEGNPIRVGASGAGWMGGGFVAQVGHVPGMDVLMLADEDIQAARQALIASGIDDEDIVEVDHPGRAMDVLRGGKRVVTGSYSLTPQLEAIDIVVDVTSSPSIGAETAYACIQHGKDIVLVNIEADVTVGHILYKLAKAADVLYTVSSGDEPGCLMELYDFVTSLGYEPIVIGKGKNNPLNPSATPETVAEIARRVEKDPYQIASYVDGTKTMFEMTCAANATGCVPMQRGMIGPEASLQNVSEIFALEEDGGITKFPGAVDFVQGSSMAGGVFVTVRVDDDRIRDDLEYLKVGSGKYFTFFRPYHLWFLEAPISVARAFLHRHATLVPLSHPVAEVLTIAKRDLKPGDRLDTFGGYTYHAVIDRAEEAQDLNALPAGLAPEATVTQNVEAGEILAWNDVELDEESLVVKLRRQQDGMFSPED